MLRRILRDIRHTSSIMTTTDIEETRNSETQIQTSNIVNLQKELTEDLKFVTKRMKENANKKRQDKLLSVEQKIFLNIKNMNFAKSKKLYHVKLESFKIIERVNAISYILQLSSKRKMHSIFHACLLNHAFQTASIMTR